jgi:lipopolysaccharide transport system permease protein
MGNRIDAPLELTIEAGKAKRHYWGDIGRFRELLCFLSWKDLLVGYKQTVLGVAWGAEPATVSHAGLHNHP